MAYYVSITQPGLLWWSHAAAGSLYLSCCDVHRLGHRGQGRARNDTDLIKTSGVYGF